MRVFRSVAMGLIVLLAASALATDAPVRNLFTGPIVLPNVMYLEAESSFDAFSGGGPGRFHFEKAFLTSGAYAYTQDDGAGVWDYRGVVDLAQITSVSAGARLNMFTLRGEFVGGGGIPLPTTETLRVTAKYDRTDGGGVGDVVSGAAFRVELASGSYSQVYGARIESPLGPGTVSQVATGLTIERQDTVGGSAYSLWAKGPIDRAVFEGRVLAGTDGIDFDNSTDLTDLIVGSGGIAGAKMDAVLPVAALMRSVASVDLVAGDVVIQASGSENRFIDTASAGNASVLGVLLEPVTGGITDTGRVALYGTTFVNCDATAITAGDWLTTSTTNGKCTSVGASPSAGSFARALTSKGAGAGSVMAVLVRPAYQSSVASLTVRERDGSPSLGATTILDFDQADGLTVASGGGGIANVDLLSASTTQKGAVDTAQQAFAGFKIFANGGQAGPSPSSTPIATSTAATPTPTSVTPTPTATVTAVWTDYGHHDIKGSHSLRMWNAAGTAFGFALQFVNTLVLRPPTGGVIDLQDPVGTSTTRIRGDHIVLLGAAPALGACGIGATIAAYSTDGAGRITTGVPAQIACTITFATAWTTNVPVCWCQDETTNVLTRAVPSLGGLTCNGVFVASDVLTYGCTGME